MTIIYYKNNLVRFSFFDDILFQKLSILLPHPLLAFLCILLTFCIVSHTANIWKVLCPIKKGGHELYLLYIYKYLLILGIFWRITLPFTIMQQDADLKGAYRRTIPSTVDFCQTQNCKKKSAFFCIVWTRTQEQNKKSTQMIL